MPTKPSGVYVDGRGGWYFKARLPAEPVTGRREQVTKRGFRTAAAAGRARRDLLAQIESGRVKSTSAGLTVDKLLDVYLDGLDADGALSAKTRYDCRHYVDDYVRPHLGSRRIRDVTPEARIAAGHRTLGHRGGCEMAGDQSPPCSETRRRASGAVPEGRAFRPLRSGSDRNVDQPASSGNARFRGVIRSDIARCSLGTVNGRSPVCLPAKRFS